MNARKVLVVDDETDIRSIAGLCLRKLGKCIVALAESGEEGLKLLREFAPDVVLLDVMMPGMDGLTMLETMRRGVNPSVTPVIFMTARVQSKEKDEYMCRGARGVISKPFDPMTLHRQMEQILEA